MKLFYSASSPFARKARIVAREKGLTGGLQELECDPCTDPEELKQHNRLLQVPTLVSGDLVLYDSAVICEYLDSRNETPRLIPVGGGDRWRVLRAQALADGLSQLVSGPAAKTEQRWRAEIESAVDMMEEQLPDLSGILNLGHIAFAASLGYLDYRHPGMQWREAHPALASWFDPFCERPAMKQTAPVAPVAPVG